MPKIEIEPEVNERVVLSKDEAIAMLPDKEFIHTFMQAGFTLIGADWSREQILKAIDDYIFELSGEIATSMNHGMVFFDDKGPVFVETKKHS